MLKARDIMTENPVSVQKDTPIYEALELLAKHNISGIPVVREDMILVGVLSETFGKRHTKFVVCP
jgi:CBS domain-containing protein